MVNDFDEIIKKIMTNLNKNIINENDFPEMNLSNLGDDSSENTRSDERQNLFKMILEFSVNVIYFSFLFQNFEILRENLKKETIKVVDNLNTSKIMLMNSIPPELLKMKMSVVSEHLYNQNNAGLKTSDKVQDDVDIQRNCILILYNSSRRFFSQ